jgi:hypothetical protein
VNSRKAARQALAGLIDDITTFQAVYARETPDFGGLSPVAMIRSEGTRPGPALALGAFHREHALLISIYWKWQSTTEDDIDDLSEDVLDLLEANSGPTANWDSLSIDETFSAMDYPIVDGVMYRVEQIRVLIW